MNRRILVVDDEKDIVQAYLDLLNPAPTGSTKVSSRRAASTPASGTKAGEYEILHAYSGEEALALMKMEYAAGKRIVGGFFDVKLEGGMDGLQLIQQLWAIDPDLLCTVVTAYHDRTVDDIDQLFGERFKDQWDYLNKPFTQAEIVQKARQMVASWNRKEQLKQAQRQLIESERMAAIGQIARSIGHEFGNILLAILGNADLATNPNNPEKTRERLQVIIQAAERANLIVRNLSTFSKGSSERVEVDPAQLVSSTLSLLSHEAKKYNVTFETSLQPTPAVTVSASEIEQVLLNLVINAMHAMPNGGAIELGCEASGEEGNQSVSIWVKDSGTGIAPEILPHIFDYAYTTKGDRGSGLGLAISKQIIEAHGGTLSVKTSVGAGSTFTVRLPA